MSKDYQTQFDEALEVIQISESEGYKTLMGKLTGEMDRMESERKKIQDSMLEEVRKGGVSSENVVQQLIRVEARLDGLKYIINQVSFFERRRDEASNHLE